MSDTTKLPDELVEKVARALCEAAGVIPDAKVSIGQDSWETFIPEAAKVCEALDISGIISDLRFYGRTWDGSPTPDLWEDAGQRARTRLSKMGVE